MGHFQSFVVTSTGSWSEGCIYLLIDILGWIFSSWSLSFSQWKWLRMSLHQLRYRYHRISPHPRGVLSFEGLTWEDAWQQCVQWLRSVTCLSVPFSKHVSAWHSDTCHTCHPSAGQDVRLTQMQPDRKTGFCCNWQHNYNNLTLFCSGLMDLLPAVFEIRKRSILPRASQKGRIFSLISDTA